mgnify:CR=1 FL=1
MNNPYEGLPSLVLKRAVPIAAYEAERGSQEGGAVELSVVQALEQLFGTARASGGDEDGAMLTVAAVDHLTKLDVIHLQEELDLRCARSRARSFGVDAVREALYDDCFNEIIRQVTIGCPERGLLLAQLRDELHETNDSFDVLFTSASQFGARKTIERDLKRTMQRDLETLLRDVAAMENRVNEIKAKYDGLEKRFIERRAAEEKRHQEEVTFIKKGNSQLTNEIKRLST